MPSYQVKCTNIVVNDVTGEGEVFLSPAPGETKIQSFSLKVTDPGSWSVGATYTLSAA